MTLTEQIVARVASLLEADDKKKEEHKKGTVKAVPGKGLWKARNRKGTVKVFTNTTEASKFASESVEHDDNTITEN